MLEIIKPVTKQAEYTLFIPFTREWLIDEFLEQLDTLYMPLGVMEFVFYNDTNSGVIQGKLRDYLENKNVANAKLYQSRRPAPEEVNLDIRRQRIVDMKNESRDLLSDSKYTICLEDDTFIQETDAIARLIQRIDKQENIGFVSGVQRGRHGFSIIGAWKMDDVNNPTVVSTLPYKEHGIQEVDGAGMYFYITPTNLYKQATYHFDAECLGPDVCYVMDLRKQHYTCLVDWRIVCGHKTQTGLLLPTEECMVVTYEKQDDSWRISEAHAQAVDKSVKTS